MASVAEELKFGKENGACGVYLRGLEAERSLSDPYFYPMYEQASEAGLAGLRALGQRQRIRGARFFRSTIRDFPNSNSP